MIKKKKTDDSPFENQLNEIKERQRHANNPGHWYGGNLPSTQRNAFDTPIYTISFGLLLVVYSIFSMIKDILDKNKDSFQIFKIIALWLVPVVLSFLILIRGIKIAVRKHKKVLKKGKK